MNIPFGLTPADGYTHHVVVVSDPNGERVYVDGRLQ